jgi:bacillithiol biosynthesis deacetylase BshB1
MKLDILVIVAHPDDAELAASGTIIKSTNQGKKVGVIDLTRGELGSRGTPETRAREAEEAARIMNLAIRKNLGLPDGYLDNSKDQQLVIVPHIRLHQPEIVITNAISDRHPDHGKASKLVSDACFLSGLRKIETRNSEGSIQEPWRPLAVYHSIQDRYLKPDFIVDISAEWDQKMKAILAYTTQFHNSTYDTSEPTTPISTPEFIHFLEARAREFGRLIQTNFGEGFTTERPVGINDLNHLL